MEQTKLYQTKEMVLDQLSDLFIPIGPDPQTSLNGQHALVEIPQFFADIGSNSPVLILIVLF
jgi:hypothetical protein